MTTEQLKEKRVTELRKICDEHFREFPKFLLNKTATELRIIGRELGVEGADLDAPDLPMRQLLSSKITDLIRQLGGYRYIEGRLEILPDGSGFLREVHLATTFTSAMEYDNYDVYVPKPLIQRSRLKQGDTVAGQRRWPYLGEEFLVLLEASEIKHNDTENSIVATGRCEDCEHFRSGRSVTRPSYDAVLDSLKSHMQAAYTQKLQAERQTSDQALVEIEENIQQERIDFTRRPTLPRIRYCGLDEFESKFYVSEVKNQYEKPCEDFSMKRPDSDLHSCKSCRYHRQPSVKLVQVVEQIAGSRPKGRPVRDQIRQSLQYQAETEFDACVEGVGLLTFRPGILPLCEARSSLDESDEPRYVIGPVANVGESCDRWESGNNAESAKSVAELNALIARAQRAVKEYTSPSVLDDNVNASTTQRQSAAGNAQADVIEYCLKGLGVSPEFIESMCSQFTLDVWFSERKREELDDPGADAGSYTVLTAPSVETTSSTSGSQQSQGFPVTINTNYRHIEVEDLHFVIYQYPPYFTAQVNYIMAGKQDLFDLSKFQPGVWTQLIGQRGPIPIALAITGAPLHQFYAMWL